jgi:peptidoglycan hydrolase-like protein with peptidoglycan-binding domain
MAARRKQKVPSRSTTEDVVGAPPRPSDSGRASAPSDLIDILRKGMAGPPVLQAQERLVEGGFAIAVDGDFGPATEEAVKAFQLRRGLTADGIIGPQTAQALAAVESASQPTSAAEAEKSSGDAQAQPPPLAASLRDVLDSIGRRGGDAAGWAKDLAERGPHLTRDQLKEVLAAANDIPDGIERAELLTALAPHLTPKQLADAVDSARAISDGFHRARALGSLAPHLPAAQRRDALKEALAAAHAVADPQLRSAALDALRSAAPEQLEQLLRDQKPGGEIGTEPLVTDAAGEIIFIGDAPKRYDDFLGRAELAFILAARLNRIWEEMNPRAGTPRAGMKPPLAARLRRAWDSIKRRSSRVWYRFLRRKCRRAWQMIVRRENATSSVYEAGFVVHLDAPWGGGKTTFANYLAGILDPYTMSGKLPDWLTALPLADDRYWPKEFRRPWLIVTFNAWQHQHVDPPWWCFYQAIRNQSSDALLHATNAQAGRRTIPDPEPQFKYRGRVQRTWDWLAAWTREIAWRLSTPQIRLSGLVTLVAGSLAVLLANRGLVNIDPKTDKFVGNFAEVWRTVAVILATLVGGGSFIWTVASTFTSSLLSGTPDAAKNYSLGSGDPLERFRTHFAKMVERLRRPVLVIVDDIDRCEPRFVVELIRGMQTILKSPRVVFLLLCDGDWIEQSFAEIHKAMKEIPVGPQHTFGRRFVEKSIQLSLMLPDISTDERPDYVRKLLGVGHPATDPLNALAEEQQKDIGRRLQDLEAEANPVKRDSKAASLHEEVSRLSITPDQKEAVAKSIDRKVALRSAADEQVAAATRHRLEPIAAVLPPNPRQIKRIINSISLFQEIARIRMGVQPDTPRWQQLALWIVLMTEWPQTWTTLATWPDLIGRVLDEKDKSAIDGLDESTIQAWVSAIRASREMMSLLDFPNFRSSDEKIWPLARLDASAIRSLKMIIPVGGKTLPRSDRRQQESGAKAQKQ